MTSVKHPLTAPTGHLPAAPVSSRSPCFSMNSLRIGSSAACRPGFVGWMMFFRTRSLHSRCAILRSSARSSAGATYVMWPGFLPRSRRTSSWSAQMSRTAAWPISIASSILASGSSFAPASTMVTESFDPATMRSSVDCERLVSLGQSSSRPSKQPTRAQPTGPLSGIPAAMMAMEDAIPARTSGSFSPS